MTESTAVIGNLTTPTAVSTTRRGSVRRVQPPRQVRIKHISNLLNIGNPLRVNFKSNALPAGNRRHNCQ
jgi:hypothetical protein